MQSLTLALLLGLGAVVAAPAGAGATPPAPLPAAEAVLPPNLHLFPAMVAAGSVLGHPYRWGGSAPGGFDCSGLVVWSFAHAGVDMPRTSRAIRSATVPVAPEDAHPGDLVFYGNPTHHVGIYLGEGLMIHAPRSGDVVKIAPVAYVGTPQFGRVK